MNGFLTGFTHPELILDDSKYIIPVLHPKQELVAELWILINQNGLQRSKTGQKAVHCAHLNCLVPIEVK